MRVQKHSGKRRWAQRLDPAKIRRLYEGDARGMLDLLDRSEPLPTAYRSSLALWRFGDDLTFVGLPGEAVADYVPMIGQALATEPLWIAAYCNESFGYLPTARILEEGGHETIGLTLDIGLFSPKVQDAVLTAVRQLATTAER